MADFHLAYSRTNMLEKIVYTDNPVDRGGPTFGGVSRKWNPDWQGWALIDKGDRGSHALMALHQDLYQIKYWAPLLLDRLPDQEVAEKIYDTAVNLGVGNAKAFACNALDLCNKGGTLWPKIGITTYAAALAKMVRFPKQRWLWFRVFETQQETWYVELAKRDPTQEAFLLGWYAKRINHRDPMP